MAPAKVEYVIFDVDGLLIDSERVTVEAANNVLSQYGKQLTPDMIAAFRGYTGRACAQKMLSTFPDIPLTIDALLAQTDEWQHRLFHLATPLPGAFRLVRHLHSHGVPIALATSSRRSRFLAKTQHSPDLFVYFKSKFVCGDDGVAKLKPEPDLFLAAAREILGFDVGVPDGACTDGQTEMRANGLVFEDSVIGVQAGKRAGMSVVWVRSVDIPKNICSGVEQPDLVLNSLGEFVPEKWGLPPYDSSETE